MKSEKACCHSVQNILSTSLQSKTMTIQVYRTLILPVVLYGCETWSLTLREEGRMRLFESRVLRRIFGSRKDEVTGKWRKLRNEELTGLYSTPNTIWLNKLRRMRWAGHVARMVERCAYRFLLGKHEGKRQLGVDGRIILRWIFRKRDWRYGLD